MGSVYAVAAFFGGDLAFDVHAEQGEVADDVEDLVADEFVVEAQGSFVEHPVGRRPKRDLASTRRRSHASGVAGASSARHS